MHTIVIEISITDFLNFKLHSWNVMFTVKERKKRVDYSFKLPYNPLAIGKYNTTKIQLQLLND